MKDEAARGYDDWVEREGEGAPGGREGEGSNSAFTFLCVVILLCGFGLIMLYSASYDEALRQGLPHYYYVKKQLLFVLLALVTALVIRFVPLSLFRFISYPLGALALLLMLAALFTPLGRTVLGARRWLSLGPLSLQPVEVAKCAMIFVLSRWFSSERKNKLLRFLPPLLLMLSFCFLIVLQRDFSSMIVFAGLCLSLFVAGGLSWGYLLLLLATLAVPATLIMLLAPYRVLRVASFLFPNLDASGASYQVTNALKAIRAGGVFGVGLGAGQYKLGQIPEVQNDFIFANMCEELGLLSMCFLIALFSLFALLGYRTYERISRKDPFLGYLVFGMTTMIVWQAVTNIAVVVGLLPPTGIPLPFFSQGGTNLFIVLCCSAVMYRIMLVSSGRLPLVKSHLRKEEKRKLEFPDSSGAL